MKIKSALIIACFALALVTTLGVSTNAQAQCCFGQILGAPIYAAGAVLTGAVAVVGGVASFVAQAVSAPFSGCCSTCTTCAPCAERPAAFCHGYCG
ncbi:MAG: hypothetical protein P4L43_10215 [Syntrophobacteraceae bacterium]|nr:hypothetical protein [Syntrophobacteraceae bacterium]